MKCRFLCVILCAVLLIGFCACDGSGKHVIKRTIEPAAVDHVWHAELSPFPEHISASGTMTVSGDKVLMNGIFREDSDSRNAQDILLQFFPAAGTYNYDPFPTPEGMPSGSVMACGILLPDGGSASVYTVSSDNPLLDEYLLTVLDADGKTRFPVCRAL